MLLYKSGGSMQWNTDQRSLVPLQTDSPHQLPGAPGSNISHLNLYQGKSSITALLKLDYTTAVAYISQAGDSITYTIADDKGPVAMVHGIEDLVRQPRMKAIPSNLSQNQPTAGAFFNRSVCMQAISSTDNICQLEAKPINYSHKCLHTGMIHNAGQVICQPTSEHDKQALLTSWQSYSRKDANPTH